MNVNGTARAPARQGSLAWALPALLLVGLVVRLLFINNEGFKTDVSTYTAWALALEPARFRDVLLDDRLCRLSAGLFLHPRRGRTLLAALLCRARSRLSRCCATLVKLPAILADLGVGALLYAIVRRFASAGLALGAAALYLLNPATIYISALWGQVDSISGGLALLAIYALLRSDRLDRLRTTRRAQTAWIVAAWLSFAYSLLIKPQAAVLLPLLVAFAFVDPSAPPRARRRDGNRRRRGDCCSRSLLTEPFHPSNPIAAFAGCWSATPTVRTSIRTTASTRSICGRCAARSGCPTANTSSVLPQYVWGIVLVRGGARAWSFGATCRIARPQALLEGCAIATLAFFVLATRMHERYLFDGLLFTIACIPFARRYLWGAIALSVVLFANLIYSLQYLHVVTEQRRRRQRAESLGPLDAGSFRCSPSATFFGSAISISGAADDARAARPATPRERPRASRRSAPAGRPAVRALVRSARGFGGNARAARLRDHGGARRRKLHSVVRRLLVAARQGFRRDLLRARRRRVSAEPADLREHASAAEQAADHASR